MEPKHELIASSDHTRLLSTRQSSEGIQQEREMYFLTTVEAQGKGSPREIKREKKQKHKKEEGLMCNSSGVTIVIRMQIQDEQIDKTITYLSRETWSTTKYATKRQIPNRMDVIDDRNP